MEQASANLATTNGECPPHAHDPSPTSLGPSPAETGPVDVASSVPEASDNPVPSLTQCNTPIAVRVARVSEGGYTEVNGSEAAQAGDLPQSPKETAKER